MNKGILFSLVCINAIAASGIAAAQNERPVDLRPQIDNCIDEAMSAIDVPEGQRGYNYNLGESWVRAVSGDHHLDSAGIDVNIDMPLSYGVMTDYKYQVAFSSEYFSYDEQVEIGAHITFLFGAKADRNAVRGFEVNRGWTDLSEAREEDLEQLIRATETMALYFSACMGIPIYEGQKSEGVRPPAYFPAFNS